MTPMVDDAGNVWEVDDAGVPVRMIAPAARPQGRVFSLAPSPKEVRQEARAEEDQQLQRENAIRAERAADRADKTANRQAAAAEKAATAQDKPTELQSKSAGFLGRLLRAERSYGALGQSDRAPRSLPRQFLRDVAPGIENTFVNSPGRQQADQAVEDFIAATLRLESGAAIADSEFERQYRIFFPSPGDSPEVIKQKAEARQQAIAGFRVSSGPLAKEIEVSQQRADNELPGQDNDAAVKPPSPGEIQAVNGGTRTTTDPEVSSLLDSMINAGAGAATINAALAKKGFQPVRDDELKAAQAWMKENPGKKYFGGNAQRTEDLSLGQKAVSALGPLGAGLANYFNAATAGTAGALAGEESQGNLAASAALNPGWAAGGNLLGAVTGALGAEAAIGGRLAAMGVQNAAKWAPRLGDAAFGAATGFNNAQDGEGLQGAVTGAGVGLAGGIVGRNALRGIGKGVRGVQDANVGYLQSQGIPMTAGGVLGGNVKRIEDALTSVPVVGGVVENRRREGIEAVASRMANDAVAPINGVVPEEFGQPLVDDLLAQGSDAYSAATAGARVPLDAQFPTDMAAARAQGSLLPDDLQVRFEKALQNRVGPVAAAGELTGDTFQQAVRGLKSYRAEATKPGFEQDYRDALSGGIDALRGQMMRGGGQNVVEELGKADEAWKRIKVIQKAVEAARGGTASGQVGLPMPSQFNNAAYQAANKFGGPRFNGELLDAAQQVLPSKLGDSGTTARALVAGGAVGLPTALGGGVGASEGGLGGAGVGGVAGGLGGMLLLAAGGSKPAQKLLVDALTKRPDAFRVAGDRLIQGARGGGAIGSGFGSSVLTPLLVSP